MKNTVNASAKDVEKFLREYGLSSAIKTTVLGNLTRFHFVDTLLNDDDKEIPVRWAEILVIENDEGTQVFQELLDGAIHKSLIDGYRKTLNTIHADILEHFKEKPKPEVPELPEPGSDVFTWLDYRHAYKQATGKKITYKRLAEMSRYSQGTFEQASKNWKNQRGET